MSSLAQNPPRDIGRSAEGLLLVEEITHRVGNEYAVAIAMLRNEARRTGDRAASRVLNSTADRLGRLSRAHQVLRPPAGAASVNLADYLEDLCAALASAVLCDQGVALTIRLDDIALPPGCCWRVGLIVAELINNAARHGFRGGGGHILLETARDGGEVVCRVVDDGCGAAAGKPGRGRRLVERLAADIGGGVLWRYTPCGVTGVLIFPAEDWRGG
jgi:two-component sensor histidine kinase